MPPTALILALLATGAGPLDAELDDLKPGMVAQYRSLVDPAATLARIEAKPAFALGASSPHPRLPPGPFEVVWTGVLVFAESSPVSFDAYVCGEVTAEIDGVVVLKGRGERESAHVGPGTPLDRPPGLYRFTVRYRSLPDLPARLQLWWGGAAFSREPLAAWHLKHQAVDETAALAADQLAEEGRAAVGRLGCVRCHSGSFPSITEPPPGPSLADARGRIDRAWLLDWLAHPARSRPDARMPALFTDDRSGFVERWLVAQLLLGPDAGPTSPAAPVGDSRMGRRQFVGVGCAACHFLPDQDRGEQPDHGRTPLTGLRERLPAAQLAAFLGNPHARYPDGRMPRLPLPPETARDLAAFLLQWSNAGPTRPEAADRPPTNDEVRAVARRLKVQNNAAATGAALLREKRCAECHPGLGPSVPADVPLPTADDRKGCLSGQSLPRFTVDEPTRRAIAAYQAVAARERHPSPFAQRQRQLDRAGCVRCHQRDSDRPPALEAVGSTLGGAWLMSLPFQRAPRLTDPHQKYTLGHLHGAVREGVIGLRPARYTYLMPAYGAEADALVQALAEGDGELPAGPDTPPRPPADPTLGSLAGATLAGFQGYACLSCHIWNGQALSDPDPGAAGTDLTRVAGRIRRDWFDRYLDGPARTHPGTPMPAIFTKGKPATLSNVLDGEPQKQKDALWSHLALGTAAPSPKPPPPLPVPAPAAGERPLVAQIPVRLPDGRTLESICVLTDRHDLIVYDLGANALDRTFVGAQLLRGVQGRFRTTTVAGTLAYQPEAPARNTQTPLLALRAGEQFEKPTAHHFHGYDCLPDGVRLRRQAVFPSGPVEIVETLRIPGDTRAIIHERHVSGVPAGWSVEPATATQRYDLPPPQTPPPFPRPATGTDPGPVGGGLERPGYRAVAYPRPKTVSGEDLIMPGAVAVNPADGRVFVASLKTGGLYVLRDPHGDGRNARFEDYAGGMFQEAYSMRAERDALYVLHRRNLTRVVDSDGDGRADRFDRVAALPHGIADTYDYGYGLTRDRGGAFVFSYAPYASRQMPGSGGALRLVPGRPPEEVAYGFRNPVGWCADTSGEVFFTDNQGEWVATNKLCHLTPGRYYGFPNTDQKQHTSKPAGKAAVWVPYGWAKSINGVACDTTGGKFGPFAGQLFMAELMFGGAIVRADVERVNGEYQGTCFPFWGRGLLGPVTLAFDPKGPLYVGGITEPGWMAQPDRGALFRLDFTGEVPFEMRSIRVRPRGFRVLFTRPAHPTTARDPASYRIESWRYEYTGAYGSPELDRAALAVERVELAADGLSADLTTAPLAKDRVYLIQAKGVRSATGESLVHPAGAYTLHEVPAEPR